MSRLNPHCPICKGIGWYEAPNYSGFVPTVEPTPCPTCNQVQAPTKGEAAALVICFVVIALFLFASYGVAR